LCAWVRMPWTGGLDEHPGAAGWWCGRHSTQGPQTSCSRSQSAGRPARAAPAARPAAGTAHPGSQPSLPCRPGRPQAPQPERPRIWAAPAHAARTQGEGSDAEYEGDELRAAAAAAAWQPDPLDVDARRPARARRGADIIAMLVAIFGSKELFIAEYRRGARAAAKGRIRGT